MEVAQIGRDMARTLSLNEDLTECIALAHDLGHTPFGHAGEEAMREEMQRHGLNYEHNEQSLRIVTLLEERTKRYPGLNLNREVLEGLRKHETPFDSPFDLAQTRSLRRASLEAQLVNLADEIAYTAHDTDDGLRADLFSLDHLLHIPLIAEAAERAAEGKTEVRGQLIHLLIADAYEETERRLERSPIASFSQEMHGKLESLRTFLWEHLYNAEAVLEHAEHGKSIVRLLFRSYEASPPDKVRALQKKTGSTLPEAIKDYIAGMTDSFAEAMARESGGSL
jgi:dGTPase